MHMHMQLHTHMHTYIPYTHTHTHYTDKYTHTYTCVQCTYIQYMRVHAHAHTYTHIHTYTHTHPHTHKHPHTHTHTHSHTHTHTHIYNCMRYESDTGFILRYIVIPDPQYWIYSYPPPPPPYTAVNSQGGVEMGGELMYPKYNSCLFIQFVTYFEFYVPRVIMPHPLFTRTVLLTGATSVRRGGEGGGVQPRNEGWRRGRTWRRGRLLLLSCWTISTFSQYPWLPCLLLYLLISLALTFLPCPICPMSFPLPQYFSFILLYSPNPSPSFPSHVHYVSKCFRSF